MDRRQWKWAVSIEKKIRETKLAQAMSHLGKTHMLIALKDSVNNFMPRDRAYKILKNKADEI